MALVSWAATLRPARKLEEGMALVDRAIGLDRSRTTNKIAYTEKIAVLADQGKIQAAAGEAKRLLAEHPDDRHVLNAAGRAFTWLQRLAITHTAATPIAASQRRTNDVPRSCWTERLLDPVVFLQVVSRTEKLHVLGDERRSAP